MHQHSGRNLILAILFSHMLLLGMTQMVMPLYALSIGVSNVILGVVSGAYGLAPILLSISSSTLSNHIGRRNMIIVSFIVWIFVGLLSLSAPPVLWLVAAQILVGVADLCLWIAAMAYLTMTTPTEDHPKVMSWATATMGLGMAIGPAFGGLFTQNSGFKSAFIFILLLGSLGLILSFKLPKEGQQNQEPATLFDRLLRTHREAIKIIQTNRVLQMSVILWIVGTAGWVAMGSSIYIALLDNLGFSKELIGFLSASRAGSTILAQFSFSFLASRLGVIATVLSGVAMGGLTLTITPFFTGAPILGFIGCLGQGADRLRNPGMFTLIAQDVEKENQPLAFALISTAWAATVTLLPPLMGFIVDRSNLSVPFLIIGPIVVITSVLLFQWSKRRNESSLDHRTINPLSK